jgi:hypothetical protein
VTLPGVFSAFPAALLAAALLGFPAEASAQGRIHADPARPLPGFKPHQLPFELPRDGTARAEFRSAPFYAVILKSTKPCGTTEKERLEAQAFFPRNKVFSNRFGCEDEETITYTNVEPKFGFIAAYAGQTPAQAQAFLDGVKATGRFADANIRKMEIVLIYP